MKSTLAASLSLLGLVSALPAPSDDPVRRLPSYWTFNITSLEGPACPDFGHHDGADNIRSTRLTYGQNTVDGSEIYYWFIAYPALHVELGKNESTWCEVELQYTEYKDLKGETEGEDYRLRLHKNGTKVISTYELDDNVKATFNFKYLDADVTDSYTINGPATSGDYSEINMPGSKSKPSKVPQCGAAKLKFRTELKIEGEGKGVVESMHSTNEDGSIQYYGTQLGFSYDWEKCEE
ncbi:hypothetical protein FHL15_002809 [Xylaria flabelliformis]|uniref:Ubiquitin 3 binding protein But2 C-terminal domain-containing protein n=1 Tax=Xylaria flabelliformis TaxID=2512241 RepID=A0A553I8L1_9PEZI|nr:hypothetical protein FHL15_002809 [Xylaria flabelliformis]